jgi:hypothetical protein
MQTIEQPEGTFEMPQADDVFLFERLALALVFIRVLHHAGEFAIPSIKAQCRILLFMRTACRTGLTLCNV